MLSWDYDANKDASAEQPWEMLEDEGASMQGSWRNSGEASSKKGPGGREQKN
jgi:hypothetical protein